MSSGTPILLERDNVNDQTVILSQWIVRDGDWVEVGTLIAEVETSKANIEVTAPRAGYLEQGAVEKSEVSYEAPLGFIFDHPLATDRVPVANGASQQPKSDSTNSSLPLTPGFSRPPSINNHATGSGSTLEFPASTEYAQRFSRRAAELIQENGLSKEQFSTLHMVRALDVLRIIGEEPASTSTHHLDNGAKASAQCESSPRGIALPRQPATEVPLSRMKRSEIQALGSGTRNAVPSAVTVTCLTRGLRVALQRNPVVMGNASAVIVYESARLLRKYPMFNATYRPDTMMQFHYVNIGYAIDDGGGLKVAVLHNCDTKSLVEIAEELRSLTLAYLESKLTPTQISGGTFTISDLSGMGVSSFLPLISEDQGAILAVGGEQFLPGSRDGCYTLTLAFDHQLSDGRTAALFLNDLKDRLTSYEKAMTETSHAEPSCARCGRTESELLGEKSFMVQSVMPTGYLCNLCLAGL